MTDNSTAPPNRRVVLCDSQGVSRGECDVLEAHENDGRLHKAFSAFVFRNRGGERELLIQQRSAGKRGFPLRWANTCCSHPAPDDESICAAGMNRLREECGIQVPLREAGSFVYQARDPKSGYCEHEHDTVLVGEAEAEVQVEANQAEIANWQWVTKAELDRRLRESPEEFAPWFAPALRIAWTDE